MSSETSAPSRALAWGVHLYTATGVVWGLLTLLAILERRYVDAYIWMIVAIVVDATDGPLARRFRVKEAVPSVDGALLDNIVDYLNWTFVPVVFLWHAGWLLQPAWVFGALVLITSAFAFVHTGAKETELGYFRGFPSYWNMFVFFADILHRNYGPEAGDTPHLITTVALCSLAALSVLPVYFVYPTKAPRWRPFFIWGSVVWTLQGIAMIWHYPDIPAPLFWSSLVFPGIYLSVSFLWTPSVHRSLGASETELDDSAQ